MNSKFSCSISCLAALTLGAGSLQSAIVIESSVLNSNATTLALTVNNIADSYLILATSGNNPASSFSVDGTPMTSIFSQTGSGSMAVNFFSLDLDGIDLSSGTVDITGHAGGNDKRFSVFQLSGLPTATFITGGASLNNRTVSFSLDSDPVDGAFLLGHGAHQRNYGGATMTGFDNAGGGDTGSYTVGYGYSLNSSGIDTSTVFQANWTGGGGATLNSVGGMIAVAPIPEPSTYAMIFGALALAGAVMVRRRRS